MKEFTTNRNSKAIELINVICREERLDIQIRFETTAIGDDVIIAKGEKEEIEVLEQIFKMVYNIGL